MSDDTKREGLEPEGNGQETSLGGASEWETVPSAAPPAGNSVPAGNSMPAVTSAPVPPTEAAAYPLEPLPPVSSAPVPPAGEAVPPVRPGGYAPVYGASESAGSAGQQAPPPPQGGGPGSPPPPPGYSTQGYPPPGYPPQGPPPGYPPPPQGAYPPGGRPGGLSSTTAAAIAYVTFIPAVIFLVLDPYNRDPFVRFHAWQCIALTVVAAAISIVFAVLGVMGVHMMFWLLMLIHMLVRLVLFVFWLIALIKASQGQWYKIPMVGDLAQSFSGAE